MDNDQNNIIREKTKFQKGLESLWDLIKFALIALIIVIPIRLFIAQPFVVSGESMFPTFNNGEYLIVDELSYRFGEPNRGDVIIFRFPHDTKRFFIKRIIGLPNEKIEISNGKISIYQKGEKNDINPIVLEEPYINESFDSTGTYTTGEKEFFVMGDNRNRSSDSRSWGVLPEKMIIGRAYLRLLPIHQISYLPGHIEKLK